MAENELHEYQKWRLLSTLKYSYCQFDEQFKRQLGQRAQEIMNKIAYIWKEIKNESEKKQEIKENLENKKNSDNKENYSPPNDKEKKNEQNNE